MSTPNIRPHPQSHSRRSQRILLAVPILVSGERANGAMFSERTHTIVVSAHGALIRLHESVLVGQQLRIKNLGTNEEISCRIIDINSENFPNVDIGVEFSEPCPRFWRVSFPPADWSPRHPDAKRMESVTVRAKPSPAKK